MCTTGESNIAPLRYGDAARNDTIGYFQQGPEWISPTDTRNPTLAVRAFLISPRMPSRGWKGTHGSLKNGTGNLSHMIKAVQDNADPNYFAPFEAEATRTVDKWLGGRPAGAGGSLSTGRAATTSRERTTAVSYLFERGSRDGERESSWDCSGRLAEQVKWARWAALNTLHFVSEEELRAAAPSLEVHGDEEWLLARPAYQRGGVGRPTQEVTLRVLSDRWGVLPGAVVLMAGQGALDGRWLVDKVTDPIRSQESEVVIVRPTPKLPEPAHETRTTTTTTPGELGTTSADSSDFGGKTISSVGGARGMVDQAAAIARRYGCYVGSSLRPGDPLDHGQNSEFKAARDIGVRGINLLTGPPSPKIDKATEAIAAAFGVTYKPGTQIKSAGSDVLNIQYKGYRIQFIWRTPLYGGHMGHLHIGARKGG